MEIENSFLRRKGSALCEFVARLHQLMSKLYIDAPNYDGDVPRILREIESELHKLAVDLRERLWSLLGQPLTSLDEIMTAYDYFEALQDDAVRIHQQLSFLPTRWPSNELELVLKGIIRERYQENTKTKRVPVDPDTLILNFSTLLTGDLNFAGAITSHYITPFEPEQVSPQARQDFFRKRLILCVPASEELNSIYWPVLFHEYAHFLFLSPQGQTLKTSVNDFLKRRHLSSTASEVLIESWLDEIFSDLFCLHLVGPSYLFSFMDFAYTWSKWSLQRTSTTHPSNAIRYAYMKRVSDELFPEFHNCMTKLESYWEVRAKIDKRYSGVIADEGDMVHAGRMPSPDIVAEVVRFLQDSDIVKALLPPKNSFQATEIAELQWRLADGQFIGTKRATKQRYVDVPIETVTKHFERYARTLKEIPARMTDILTAAILFRLTLKLGSQYEGVARHLATLPEDEVIHIFTQENANEPINNALARTSDSVKRTDSTITKSFQIRQLTEFYSTKRN
jgi:hypothetical protein